MRRKLNSSRRNASRPGARSRSAWYARTYEFRAHLDLPPERAQVLSHLHGAMQEVFNEAGVQIMSPALETQPDRPVVVPPSQWFAPPAGAPGDGAPGDGTPGKRGRSSG